MYNFHFQAKEIFLKSILFFFYQKTPPFCNETMRKKKSCEICYFSSLKKPWLNWKRGTFWRKIRESSPRGISDRVETRRVKREGKFALESCGYKPCATAYPATLSTPPIESTVTQPASMPTTEIHSVDAVSRPSASKEEYGIRGGRRRKKEERQTLGVCAVYKRVLVLERFRNFHFEHVGSLLVSWIKSRGSYDFLHAKISFDLARG